VGLIGTVVTGISGGMGSRKKGAYGDGYESERIFVGAAAMGPDELVQPNGRIDATWLCWITEI